MSKAGNKNGNSKLPCGQCRNFVGDDKTVDLKNTKCPKAGIVGKKSVISGCPQAGK